jgi:hypothetical protein
MSPAIKDTSGPWRSALFFVRGNPLLVPLHADRRWDALVSRLKFP